MKLVEEQIAIATSIATSVDARQEATHLEDTRDTAKCLDTLQRIEHLLAGSFLLQLDAIARRDAGAAIARDRQLVRERAAARVFPDTPADTHRVIVGADYPFKCSRCLHPDCWHDGDPDDGYRSGACTVHGCACQGYIEPDRPALAVQLVRQLQRALDVPADGIVGPATLDALARLQAGLLVAGVGALVVIDLSQLKR